MNSEAHHKVQAEHLGRNAFLYVRQSTLRQVRENVESSQRQYTGSGIKRSPWGGQRSRSSSLTVTKGNRAAVPSRLIDSDHKQPCSLQSKLEALDSSLRNMGLRKVIGFWTLDFRFWMEKCGLARLPIRNPKSKIQSGE